MSYTKKELKNFKKELKGIAKFLPIYPQLILDSKNSIVGIKQYKRVISGTQLLDLKGKKFKVGDKQVLPKAHYAFEQVLLNNPLKNLLTLIKQNKTKEDIKIWITNYKENYLKYQTWIIQENNKTISAK